MRQTQYKPHQIEIFQDQTSPIYAVEYLYFVVNGTWSVKIDNLIYLPGDDILRELHGEKGGILYDPEIKFLEDLSEDPSVKANRRLVKGKRMVIESLKLN